jgi:hypothetical protein
MNRAEMLPHYLRALAAFKAEFGHTNVPRTYEADRDLAAWVRTVRESWRNGRLHEIHVQLLTEADFSFAPNNAAWAAQYESLKHYVEVEGNAKVPRDHENRSLAIWVMHQRNHFKAGLLEDAEIAQLNALGFVFDPHDQQWRDNLQRVKDFKKKHGHALIPRRYPEDKQLADFAAEIRKRFKLENLTATQVADLMELEFVFDPLDAVWSGRLAEYAAWRHTSGGEALPPRRIAGKPTPLYEWCRVQLRNLTAGTVPDYRKSKLATAGFPV